MSDEIKKKPLYKKWYIWAIALLFVAFIAGRGNRETDSAEVDQFSGSEETELAIASEGSQDAEPKISEKELSAFKEKADLGAKCSAFYSVASQFKGANGNQESAATDASVSKATKLYAEKYAQKAGDAFDAEEKIAEYTERFSGMLERSFQNNATQAEVDEVQSVMKKCDGAIETIVSDL